MIIGFGIGNASDKAQGDGPALEKAGCERIILVADALEAKFKLDEILQYTRDGDVLVVLGLDRLGGTLDAIVQTVDRLYGLKVALQVEGCITPGTMIGDSFVEVCHALAKQGELFRQSRAAAGANGTASVERRRGRPGSLSGVEQERAMRMLEGGRANVREVARRFKVSPATIYRLFPRRRVVTPTLRAGAPVT